MEIEIYWDDLTEDAKERIKSVAGNDFYEKSNLDICPLFILTIEQE